MGDGPRIDRAFFARHPLLVALDLLGCRVVSARAPTLTAGRIVEVEAYGGPEDLASHAGKYQAGWTAMVGPPGRAYVYRSYGIHAMLNVVAHDDSASGAVLVRALEPVVGLQAMRQRRAKTSDRELCSGPGRLCQALDIRLTDNGLDLTTSSELWLEPGERSSRALRSERIGISMGKEELWRFFDGDSRFVSPPRRGDPFETHEIITEANAYQLR